MFYVGRLYQENGDTENANAMFDKIVGEHGDLSMPRGQQRQEGIKMCKVLRLGKPGSVIEY